MCSSKSNKRLGCWSPRRKNRCSWPKNGYAFFGCKNWALTSPKIVAFSDEVYVRKGPPKYYPGRDDPRHLTVVCGDPGHAGEASLPDPRARRQYGSPSGRHDMSHRVGRHTPCAITHTRAMRTLLPMSHLRRCIQHRDGGKRTYISLTLSSCITPGPHCVLTTSSVMPRPKNPRVPIRSRPQQQKGQVHPDAPQVTLDRLPGT